MSLHRERHVTMDDATATDIRPMVNNQPVGTPTLQHISVTGEQVPCWLLTDTGLCIPLNEMPWHGVLKASSVRLVSTPPLQVEPSTITVVP